MIELAILLLVKRHSGKCGIIKRQQDAQCQKKNVCPEPSERCEEPGRMDNIQNDSPSKCSKMSTNAIDIAASFLFPTSYVIFNVIYWCSMK